MGCTDSRVDSLHARKTHTANLPFDPAKPVTLTIEDIYMKQYSLKVTLGRSISSVYEEVKRLRNSEVSLFYAGDWLVESSGDVVGDYGITGDAKVDLIDKVG